MVGRFKGGMVYAFLRAPVEMTEIEEGNGNGNGNSKGKSKSNRNRNDNGRCGFLHCAATPLRSK